MPLDPGQRKADASFDEIKARLTKVYEAAARDIIARLDDHQRRLIVEDAKRRRLVKAGKLSEAAYQDWLRRTVYRGKAWETQVKDLTDTLLDANRQALRIIEGQRLEVFTENANFMAYALERGAGMDLSFTLYDRSAVTRIIRNQPALLPTKDLDARKDAAWNRKTIANEVARGILSGASIPEISQNMAAALGRNNDGSMARYARTAMTGAQNAGRIERMQEAREMGIRVKKKWLATLDSRTRDSHAAMDGETRDIDEKFSNGLLYPGDPKGDPAETWNCRCTLINEYEEYPSKGGTRYDQENDEYVEKMTYSEWKKSKISESIGLPKNEHYGKITLSDIIIGRSLGAAAKNYDIKGPDGAIYHYMEGTRVKNVQVFAGYKTRVMLHEGVAEGLTEQFGGDVEKWQHVKGEGIIDVGDSSERAEVHWFQEETVGQVKHKIKRWLE